MGDNIKVAVRVRPFNDRETKRKATTVVEMPNGQTTIIKDAKGEPKSFTFDYSYWSHDGFKTRDDGYLEPESSKYADQMKVFNDLGRGVLDNAWKGYHCSLFAYGQTGSGKSYSMVGYGSNKGIVPIVCEELFKEIETKKDGETEYQVSVSMMEIYCEKVRDLLDSKPPPKGGLKVREHPKTGFYVEGLISAPVANFKAIESKIEDGNKIRSVAATNMNATSSRAHTIVQIKFLQKNKKANTTKTSHINLVDLAGSERHSETGSEGDRLKEGIVINQSLSTLGRVIKALADIQGGTKGIQVPYRDSVLTSLLKNALGGNSKTIMIAALSPADINYEETLSTLRFADRAKNIKTTATVNESETDRLIRELKEENDRLHKQLSGAGGGTSTEELDALKQQLERNKKEMEAMEQSWQQRLQQEAMRLGTGSPQDKKALEAMRKTTPHFWNLNEDPALTDMIVHFIKPGETKIGHPKAQPLPDIQLTGLSIQPQHAIVTNADGKKITLKEASEGARILVNGQDISGERELFHNDRVLFGGNHLYVFHHPADLERKKKSKEKLIPVTYDMAQSEIAASSGIMGVAGPGGKSKDDMILEEDLIKILPQLYQANAMSGELKKNTSHEIVLVAPQARALKEGRTEIFVKVVNKLNDNEFLWDKNKFSNRFYAMTELYQTYLEGHKDWDVPKEKDPFYESSDAEVLIGMTHVYLQSLAYMVEVDEQLPINDLKGNERGQLKVLLVPTSDKGKEIVGEFVDSPDELVGKSLSFKVKILSAVGLPRKFVTSRCRYKFFNEDKDTFTNEVTGTSPAYGHEKSFPFKPVSKQVIDYLKEKALVIEILGKQSDKGGRKPPAPSSGGSDGYKSKADQLETKLNKIQRLIDEALATNANSVSLKATQKALLAEKAALNGPGGGGGAAEPKKVKKKVTPKPDGPHKPKVPGDHTAPRRSSDKPPAPGGVAARSHSERRPKPPGDAADKPKKPKPKADANGVVGEKPKKKKVRPKEV